MQSTATNNTRIGTTRTRGYKSHAHLLVMPEIESNANMGLKPERALGIAFWMVVEMSEIVLAWIKLHQKWVHVWFWIWLVKSAHEIVERVARSSTKLLFFCREFSMLDTVFPRDEIMLLMLV